MGPDFPKVTVGRNPDCVIHTTKPSVSRLHTEFVYNRGVFEVTDLGSSNGTFINGREIRRQALRDRDEVRCGEFTIRFFTDDDVAPDVLGPPPIEDPERLEGDHNQPTSRQPSIERGGEAKPDVSGYPGEQRPYGSGGGYQRQEGARPRTVSGGYGTDQLVPVDTDRLKVDNLELREKVADQQAVIDVMRDSSGGPSDLERLRHELDRSKASEDVLRRERDEVLAVADGHREKLSELERELSQQTLAIESFQDKNRSLIKEVDGLRGDSDTARAEAVRAKGELGVALASVAELERLDAEHRATIEVLTEQGLELRASLSKVEKSQQDTQQLAQEAEQQTARLRQEVESLRSLVDDEGSDAQDLRGELGDLRSVLEGKESELVESERRASQLEDELQTLRASQEAEASPDADLVEELESRQKTISDLERQNDALRSALEEEDEDAPERAELKAAIAGHEAAISERDERVAALEAKLEGVGELDGQVEEVRGELASLTERNASLEQELEAARQNIQSNLEEASGRVEDLEAEVEDLRAANRRHNEEMDRLMAEEEGQPSLDGDGLRIELDALSAENARLKGDLNLLAEENDRLEGMSSSAQVQQDAGGSAYQVVELQEDLHAAFSELEQAKVQLIASQKWLAETTTHIGRTAEALSATSQQLAAVSDDELAADTDLRAQVTGSYEVLDVDVTNLNDHVAQIAAYVREIRKIYSAIQRADLQPLQTLDRVRIEKVFREVDPDRVFDSLNKAVDDCSTGAEAMREQLRDYREKIG
jgi:chromosome segregation ATPase